jgi:metal-dependent HD superfamily phosphatase/phosphodiesterase
LHNILQRWHTHQEEAVVVEIAEDVADSVVDEVVTVEEEEVSQEVVAEVSCTSHEAQVLRS